MEDLIRTFTLRGDLAHLALFLWASSASALAWFALRELAAAMRRFDEFVRELSRFNKRFGGNDGSTDGGTDGRTDGHPAHCTSRHSW